MAKATKKPRLDSDLEDEYAAFMNEIETEAKQKELEEKEEATDAQAKVRPDKKSIEIDQTACGISEETKERISGFIYSELNVDVLKKSSVEREDVTEESEYTEDLDWQPAIFE